MPYNNIKIRKIKARKIIFKDYLSFVLLLANAAAIFIWPFGLLVWTACIPFLVCRTRRIKKTLENGITAKGILTEKYFFRGKWRLKYTYEAKEQKCSSGNSVLGFKIALQKEQEVDVTYDPEKPLRAYLPAVYQ